jgi:hypothetical protein
VITILRSTIVTKIALFSVDRRSFSIITSTYKPLDFPPCAIHGLGQRSGPCRERFGFGVRWVGGGFVVIGEEGVFLANHNLGPLSRVNVMPLTLCDSSLSVLVIAECTVTLIR